MADAGAVLKVCAAVADLMFASRIRAAANAAGVECVFARSTEELEKLAAGADLVLIDSETRWLDVPASVGALKAAAVPEVVVFGPHVNGAALVAAREAGADRVLARSAFVTMLPELLKRKV